MVYMLTFTINIPQMLAYIYIYTIHGSYGILLFYIYNYIYICIIQYGVLNLRWMVLYHNFTDTNLSLVLYHYFGGNSWLIKRAYWSGGVRTECPKTCQTRENGRTNAYPKRRKTNKDLGVITRRNTELLWMEEILHHLGWLKSYK